MQDNSDDKYAIRRANGEIRGKELADILEVMDNNYLSDNFHLELFVYFDDTTGRYVPAVQATPIKGTKT